METTFWENVCNESSSEMWAILSSAKNMLRDRAQVAVGFDILSDIITPVTSVRMIDTFTNKY